jgi:lipoprotein NlpI
MSLPHVRARLALVLIFIAASPSWAEEPKTDQPTSVSSAKLSPPLSDEDRERLAKTFEKAVVEATQQIELDSAKVDAYSRRGDAYFFQAQFDKAVADYDQMVQIDESLANSHWRRGIGLFYAGKFQEAAAQFESYHSFDQVDRENGIWRYLSQHKAYGRDKAREGLLKYEKDDREPFPSVYKLFAGTVTPEQILYRIDKANVSKSELEKRLFYAHLYIGFNYSVEGNDKAAQQHLYLSTLNKWAPSAGYGPNYMWHVGRLHEERLRTKAEKK